MAKVRVLSCVTCGAPLRLPARTTRTQCSYCAAELVIDPKTQGRETKAHAAIPTGGDGDTADDIPWAVRLMRGYARPGRQDVGRGQRYDVRAMAERDWRCHEFGVWPVSARASSSFGGGWSASAIVGAPRVYPAVGDRMGAWAPRSASSKTEWIEARYPDGAPPVRAIRVFETCVPGATFAVTGDAGDGEELLWTGAPKERHGAQVLEIEVSPPRRFSRVRAYVDNSIAWSWSEIDTICLVATAPVPAHLRRKPPFLTTRGWIFAGLAVAVMFGALVMAAPARRTNTHARSEPRPWHVGAAPLAEPPRADMASGVIMAPWIADGKELVDRVSWASFVHGVSTEYSDTTWNAHQVLGRPNVYPRHGDIGQAWASKDPARGEEWIEVGFEMPTRARGLVIVETFNPGAVVRVDDTTDPDHPVALWRGRTEAAQSSRLLRLSLPSPRKIGRVRVVLDTSLVPGWNEIDAIGVLRAQ